MTLYLSISLALIISLLCYTIESCHLDSQVCRAEGASYISTDSLLAHYCLPLYTDYGIFALNEQGLDMEKLLGEYAQMNCEAPDSLLSSTGTFLGIQYKDADISSYTYLTDQDGEIFAEQVSKYVVFLEVEAAIDALLEQSSEDIPDTFAQTEDGTADINFDELDDSVMDTFWSSDLERTGDTTEDLSGVESGSFLTTITTNISHHIGDVLLSCLVPDPTSVSTAAIDKIHLPSVTCQLSQEGIESSYGYYKDIGAVTYEKAAFCEYIRHTFGCYTSPASDSSLQYEMEYIISGEDSDDANLISTAGQLIALRAGLNLIHLVTDSDKFNAAWSIAEMSSSIPGAPYLIQATILTIWATAEAVIDVRDLLAGKNVPLFKTADQWNLSIKSLLGFSKDSASLNKGTEGLSYSRYLELLLAKENVISLRYRTMDLIQISLCHQYSSDFRLARCVTGINGSITYSLPCLLSAKMYTYSSSFKLNYQ